MCKYKKQKNCIVLLYIPDISAFIDFLFTQEDINTNKEEEASDSINREIGKHVINFIKLYIFLATGMKSTKIPLRLHCKVT